RARSWRRGLDAGERDLTSGVDERREDQRAVGRAEQRVDRVLGVRHQAEAVAVLVRYSGDARNRAVERLRVPEDDLAARLDLVDEFVIRVPAALAVLGRDRQERVGLAAGRE